MYVRQLLIKPHKACVVFGRGEFFVRNNTHDRLAVSLSRWQCFDNRTRYRGLGRKCVKTDSPRSFI